MNRLQKHELSRKIVQSLSRIQTYKDTINRIKANEKLFHEATFSVRLVGIRNTVWEDLTPQDVIYFLRRKLVQEKLTLTKLEKLLK